MTNTNTTTTNPLATFSILEDGTTKTLTVVEVGRFYEVHLDGELCGPAHDVARFSEARLAVHYAIGFAGW